ncbi:MAG: hypothetical protein MJ149_01970 [Clostridia bacterium]|nr:hypothetical protein [Clostridia bacterium]
MYNLTDLANRCLQVGQQFASNYGNEFGTEHVLYGLAKVDSKAKSLLNAFKVSADVIKQVLDNVSGNIPSSTVEITPRTRELLMIAGSIAKRTHSAYISPEHLLVALLSQEDSFAINILAGALKLNVFEMRNRAIMIIASNKPERDFEDEGLVAVGNLSGSRKKPKQEFYK